MMNTFRQPEIKEFMIGFTVEDYDYTATEMKLHIPELMMDKEPSSSSSNIQIPSNIFKSKENIYPSTSLSNNNYISIKVGVSFTATYKTLGYDNFGDHPSPQFPTGSKVIVFIPNANINDAVIVPLT